MIEGSKKYLFSFYIFFFLSVLWLIISFIFHFYTLAFLIPLVGFFLVLINLISVVRALVRKESIRDLLKQTLYIFLVSFLIAISLGLFYLLLGLAG